MLIPFGDPVAIGYAIYLFCVMESIFPQFHYKFVIENEGNKSAILKTINIDGHNYLDSEVRLKPGNRDPMQLDESSYSLNVFRPAVKTFEMVVQNEDGDITYSCELITKTGRIFFIGFGSHQPFLSPLEGVSSPLDSKVIRFQHEAN